MSIGSNTFPARSFPPDGTTFAQVTLGDKISNVIPPYSYWNMQFYHSEAAYVRFELGLPRSASLGLYGRRNALPTHTHYDMLHIISGYKSRARRASTVIFFFQNEIINGFVCCSLPFDLIFWVGKTSLWYRRKYCITWNLAIGSFRFTTMMEILKRPPVSSRWPVTWLSAAHEDVTAMANASWADANANPVSAGTIAVKVSFWFLIWKTKQKANNSINTKCFCPLEKQTKGVCPVLCSGRGDYINGQCQCNPGWKGRECSLKHDECEVPDCSGHGKCSGGKCLCGRGFKGEFCDIGNNIWFDFLQFPQLIILKKCAKLMFFLAEKCY